MPERTWDDKGFVRYYHERLKGRKEHPPRGKRPVTPREESRDYWEYLSVGPALFKYIKVVRDKKRHNTRARRRAETRMTREEVDDWLQ